MEIKKHLVVQMSKFHPQFVSNSKLDRQKFGIRVQQSNVQGPLTFSKNLPGQIILFRNVFPCLHLAICISKKTLRKGFFCCDLFQRNQPTDATQNLRSLEVCRLNTMDKLIIVQAVVFSQHKPIHIVSSEPKLFEHLY